MGDINKQKTKTKQKKNGPARKKKGSKTSKTIFKDRMGQIDAGDLGPKEISNVILPIFSQSRVKVTLYDPDLRAIHTFTQKMNVNDKVGAEKDKGPEKQT